MTTILRDAGLPVARVKLAQAPSSELIRAVCNAATIRRFASSADMESYLAGFPPRSLFILGLDNHVGFVMKAPGGNYFVNASYMGDQEVVKELLAEAGTGVSIEDVHDWPSTIGVDNRRLMRG